MTAYCCVASCGKEAETRRMCAGHAEQSLGVEKLCRTCRRWLPRSKFGPSPKAADGLRAMCRVCRQAERYGVSHVWVEETLATQGHECAICHTSFGANGGWAIDHDHSCCPSDSACGKCVRGLLCRRCNSALGYFKDSVSILIRASAYLEAGK